MPAKNSTYDIEVFISSRCNYACKHCGVAMKGFAEAELTLKDCDIELISDYVSIYHPSTVRLTGGEPTLNIEIINKLINAVCSADPTIKIAVTTNAWFSKEKYGCRTVLGGIIKLDELQISYDKYHAEFLPEYALHTIKKYCHEKGIILNAAFCISSPTDLMEMKRIAEEVGIDCSFQNTIPLNEAKHNKTYYQYYSFDQDVLGTRCPNIKGFFYMPGLGFTKCCSSLLFSGNRDTLSYICTKNVKEVTKSHFHLLLIRHTFGALAKLYDVNLSDLQPQHSEPCILCYHLFKRIINGMNATKGYLYEFLRNE